MKIILRESVENLGRSGDIVNVKDGYARNYLIPKGYAIKADDKSIKYIEHQKRLIQIKVDKEKKDLERVAELLNQKKYSITRKLATEDKLYGSVSTNDIYELLVNDGFKVFKSDIHFDTVKQPGEYKAQVDLGHGIKSELQIEVIGEETADTKKTAREDETVIESKAEETQEEA